MSGNDVGPGRMPPHDGGDAELQALRTGRVPSGRDDLRGLAELGAALRASLQAEPVPPPSGELAELIRSAGATVAPAGRPPPWPFPAGTRRRRLRVVVAGALASLGIVGGLGAAGALPAPVQRAVASSAEVVGLDFPRPASDVPAPSEEVAPAADACLPGPETTTTSASAPSTSTPAGACPPDPSTASSEPSDPPSSTTTPSTVRSTSTSTTPATTATTGVPSTSTTVAADSTTTAPGTSRSR